MMSSRKERDLLWPSLPYAEWKDTYDTLHMWMQVIGKLRLKLSPFINHWWEVAFYLTPRGLRSSAIPYESGAFEVQFDFVDHALLIETASGARRMMALAPRSVAEFHFEVMNLLESLGIRVEIDRMPKEVPDPIPFDEDVVHGSYDREYASRWWRILVQCDRIFQEFRSGFIGKCSPVHFFWGSFDHVVTRFSGRRAPPRPDADHITQVAYSHEVSSCGFWPGSGNILEPAFYAYAAPEPLKFPEAKVPDGAFYNPTTKGFILPYELVRKSADPDRAVLEFCQSTYDAAADLGNWNREELERRSKWRVAA